MTPKQSIKELDHALSSAETSDWQKSLLKDMKAATNRKQRAKRRATGSGSTPKVPVPQECPPHAFKLGAQVYTLYGDYPRVLHTSVQRIELCGGRWLYAVAGREDLVEEGALFDTLHYLETICRGRPVEPPAPPTEPPPTE